MFLNQFSSPISISNKKRRSTKTFYPDQREVAFIDHGLHSFSCESQTLYWHARNESLSLSSSFSLLFLSHSTCACVSYGFCMYFFFFFCLLRVCGGVSSCNQCIPNEGKGVFFLDNNPSHQSETGRRM